MAARLRIIFDVPTQDMRHLGFDATREFERTYTHQLLEGYHLQEILADMIVNEQVSVEFIYDTAQCPYTHSHTRHWCGYDTCRDS